MLRGLRAHAVPGAVVTGGALVVAGALLPWLTFFAGLQSYGGMVGLYGRLLLAGGIVAVLLGAALVARRSTPLLVATGALGAMLAGLAAWSVTGLVATVQRLATDPMALAGYGPGPFVALVGALVVATAPAFMRRASRR